MSNASAPSPGAPFHPGEKIMPRYRDIGADPDRPKTARDKRSGLRWKGEWWGRSLPLLPVGVALATDAGFVPAIGANGALLIGADGLPLAGSFRERKNYGPKALALHHHNAEKIVFDQEGRRHPRQEASRFLTGPRVPGDTMLLGMIDARFGHFLTESLARAWALEWGLAQGMRVLIWGTPRPYHREAFALLGLDDRDILIAEPGMVFDRLHIPDASYRLLGSVSIASGLAWDRMARTALRLASDPAPFDERFLYLSRAGTDKRKLVNEAEFEHFLAARGGRIFRPETVSFTEQVRIVRQAPAIVGCFGSQLHLSMFQQPGTRKLVIGREDFVGPDETTIAIGNGTVIDHYIEPVDPDAARDRRYHPQSGGWSIDMARFRAAFDEWAMDAISR